MDSTSSDSFSKSILDKFRLISKESEDPKPVSGKNTSNGSVAKDQAKSNDNESGTKRKHSNTVEENGKIFIGLKEKDVGISQYVSSIEGFSGIIKHRFSDFHVNEIDLSGNVVELTSFEIPPDPVEEEIPNIESILTPDEWDKVSKIATSTERNPEPLLIDVTEKSKDERTHIHLAIRKKHPAHVISNTVDIEDQKFIKVIKKTKRDYRGDWPKGRGIYLHCHMHKVSKDTTELVNLLAEKLRTKNNLIGYAGTKDKRGKTTQRVSFKRITAETLLKLKIRNVLFGNFSYKDKEIQLGENQGNRFKIAIRNVSASDELIEANMSSLKNNGFINYFGLQRFGNFSDVPTYAIGKALLASDWKLAVELMLKPKPNSKRRKELLLAQQSWYKDRNAATAVKWIPKFDNSIEAKILRTLKSQGNNAYLNAIMALPRNTMTLYMHSYQSLIWNRIISKRIQKFGLKPLVGDLLVALVEEVDSQVEKREGQMDQDSEDEDISNSKNSNDNEQDDDKRSSLKKKVQVREITEEELDSVSISDVVYPLPGRDVIYPNNEIKTWYEEILAEDNFTFENFSSTHQSFSLSGAYRKILMKPGDITWEIVHSDSLNQDLILSDEDKLNNVALNNPEDGQYKSVVVFFNLDSCSYATMALREIIKCDTSAHHQAKLTENFKATDNESPKKMKTDQDS